MEEDEFKKLPLTFVFPEGRIKTVTFSSTFVSVDDHSFPRSSFRHAFTSGYPVCLKPFGLMQVCSRQICADPFGC
jgi:hypothetical protein